MSAGPAPESERTYLIGELAEECGVSAHVLRAWERRFSLISPRRTAGGYRVYDDQDVAVVRRMIAYRAEGQPAADAARRARQPASAQNARPRQTDEFERSCLETIWHALVHLDRDAAVRSLETVARKCRPTTQDGADALVGRYMLPLVRQTGEAWRAGQVTTAQTTFTCEVLRAFLIERLADVDTPSRTPRTAWLACPTGERHDLVVLCFALLLGTRGWQVRFFGANCPVEDLVLLARQAGPDVVVLGVQRGAVLRRNAATVARLASVVPTAIGGPAARTDVAVAIGAHLLDRDLVSEADALADRLTAGVPGVLASDEETR